MGKTTIDADRVEKGKRVAEDGRLWLGEDFAGEKVEFAVRIMGSDE